MGDTYLTDHFLVAMPNLRDQRFHHAVAYICSHDQNGALGVVINKPLDMMPGEVWLQVGSDAEDDAATSIPIYDGGPVKTGEGFVLCQDEGKVSTRPWQSSADHESGNLSLPLDMIASSFNSGSMENIFIALGYTGWTAGQLELELRKNSWLSVSAKPHIIFDTPVEQRWSSAVDLLGFNITQLSANVGHA